MSQQEKMRNILEKLWGLKKQNRQQEMWKILAFKMWQSEQWIVADGTGAELFIIIFLFPPEEF